MIITRKTIGNVINTYSEKYSDNTVLLFDNEKFSFCELRRKASILAFNLSKLGVKKGDKVAVIMNNRVEYIFCYYAIALIGACVIPINIRYEVGELKNVLYNSEASTIIYEKHIDNFNYQKILNEIKGDLLQLQNCIILCEDEIDSEITLQDLMEIEDEVSYENILAEVSKIEEEIEEDATFLLAYTSGTTGNPKGVMLQHNNLVSICQTLNDIWNEDVIDKTKDQRRGVTMSIAPLYAAQGFMSLFIELLTGHTLQMCSSFVPNEIIRYMINKEITDFHTQPTFWNLLLMVPYFHHANLKHIQRCVVSGSLCSPSLAKKIAELTGGTIINAYGLVEASCINFITRTNDTEEITFNTVGQPIDGVEYKIVDSDRIEVPTGEVGELVVRGFNMKGYYKNPEKTREVIDDSGWLYTGDLVKMYDNNNISIVGRSKDMVIRGAFNVYPSDIEECLGAFEKVHDIAVVGKPNEILGESLVAFVVPKAGVKISEGEIIKYCRGKISNYKIPDDVVFISQMPIIESGKVLKNTLRDWAVSGIPETHVVLFDNQNRENVLRGE